MKKLLMLLAMALSTVAMAEMSLADARGKIGDVVVSPDKMSAIMKELSSEDQVAFLAEVNAAIDNLRASTNEKTMLFLQVNEAALKSANKGNLQALLAESYATVPCEALTVLNERYATDLFSRNANPTRPVSDADFQKTVTNTMQVIVERMAKTDDSDVRTTFAILTFLRASEGTPADLAKTLVEVIPDAKARDLAMTEWIPSAMAEGMSKTYEPMLGAADAGIAPTIDFSPVTTVAPSEGLVALAADIGSTSSAFSASTFGLGVVGIPQGLTHDVGVDRIPRTRNPIAPWNSDDRRGREPDPYDFQTL